MSGIDNRVVSMKFDNAQFEKGVSTTISSMDKLKQSLNTEGAQKHLQGLSGTIAKFNMGGMEGAITGVSNSFLALSTIGITALSRITDTAINAGVQLAKSLTITPIAEGFSEYELKMGSIQTILANTARYGTKLPEVTAVLEDLNKYSDKTIYNFGDMTKNIGLFTNAGLKVKDAAEMIKGFSNEAAASGTSAQGAANAAYQLSQALSAGKVTLMDWKSLTNVGMGNKNMQRGIIDIAKALGTFKGKGNAAKVAQTDFNASLESGWLTADVMSTYLRIMSGDIDEAKMKSLGLSKEQIKVFKQQQKTAEEAATKVRTFSQLIGTLREAVGSGWSETFEIIFGNFDEATTLFTNLSNAIGGWVQKSSEARNEMLKEWKKEGGRTSLIAGLTNIFKALGKIIQPIAQAFRDMFPPMTGKHLADLTKNFENFTKHLVIGDEAMDNLKRTFRGIFAVFSILRQLSHGVIKVILSVFDALSGPAGGAGGGFLTITAQIGDFISGIDTMLKKSKAIEKFFGAIGWAIAGVIKAFDAVARSVVGLFTGGDTPFFDNLATNFKSLAPIVEGVKTRIQDIVQTIKDLFSSFHLDNLFGVQPAADKANASLDKFQTQVTDTTDILSGLKKTAKRVVKAIGDMFGWLGEQIGKITEGTTIEDWLALLDTVFFVQMVRIFKKFGKVGLDIAENYAGILENVKNITSGFGGTMKAFQKNVQAKAIMRIAIALLLLAIAIWILSKVDPLDTAIGLGALAVMLGMLSVAMKMFLKGMSDKSAKRLAVISVALIGLAVAMTMFAGAIAILGNMDLGTLAKGIGAMAAVLVLISWAMTNLERVGGAKKMAALAGSLMLMAIAFDMLAAAIFLYAKMDLGTLWSGLYKIVAVLAVLAVFMKVISGSQMTGSMVGLIAAAIAINILAGAIKQLGNIGLLQLAKGLFAMSFALGVLAIAMLVMQEASLGALALLGAAIAIRLLVPALKDLGELSWGVILKGLAALVLLMLAIGIGSMLLAPAVPILVLFAAAVLMLGAAMFLAGMGMALFAGALALLSVVGAAGFAVLTAAIITFIELLPLIGEQLGLAIVAWAKVIGDKAPELVKALGKLLSALLQELVRRAPEFYQAMFDLLLDLMQAIIDNMPEIADRAVEMIETFVDTFGSEENIKKVTSAAADLVTNFLNGLADTIRDKDQDLVDAGKNIGKAVIGGIALGMAELTPIGWAISHLVNFIKGDAEAKLEAHSPSRLFIPVGGTIPAGLAVGIKKYTYMTTDATEKMGDETVTSMQDTIARISDVVDTDMNMEPVIAPVLDLTAFRKTAEQMGSVLQANPLTASVSLNKATDIAATKTPVEEAAATAEQAPIKFEQNNYSPKALSPAEIYRNTRNQLTYAKELMAG